MRRGLWAMGVAAIAAASGAAIADDVATTITAAKENVTFYVETTGTFDATAPVEVIVKTRVFGEELEVEECTTGGPVEKGDPLVRFKTERIDEALRTAERDLGIAKAGLAAQTEDQSRQAEATAIGLARAEFAARTTREALERFEKVDMPLRLEEADHGLQGTRNWIADQVEEFTQLEKMYKADDLTEETEEIVMMRSRRDLERAKRSLDFQTRHDKVLREIDLPRDLENLRIEARRTTAEHERAVAVSKLQEAQAKLELERTRANVETQQKQFDKLTADREMLTVVAPASGVAVPGALLRGKWQNLDDVKRALRKGGKLRPNETLFTIVQPGVTRVLATVPESALLTVEPGEAAQVAPIASGDAVLDAQVATVSPVATGTDFNVTLDLRAVDDRFRAGYGCKVRITTGTRSAIVVPAGAIEDGFEKAVYVVADGRTARRPVRTGATVSGKVEIVSGLSEGDHVLATPPAKK